MRVLVFLTIVLCTIKTKTAEAAISIQKRSDLDVVQNWIEHYKSSTESAGILWILHARDSTGEDIAKDLETMNNHLDFFVTRDARVQEFGYEVGALYLVRDEAVLKIDIPRDTPNFFEEVDLWLSLEWTSRVTRVTMHNQRAIFGVMAPSTRIVLVTEDRASDRTTSAFRTVADKWTSRSTRSDLPRFVYASKSHILSEDDDDVMGNRDALKFWTQLTRFVFGKDYPRGGAPTDTIAIVHAPRGMRLQFRELYTGDASSVEDLSYWVSSTLRRLRQGPPGGGRWGLGEEETSRVGL